MMVEAEYRSSDGVRIVKRYKTFTGLRKFIDKWVGYPSTKPLFLIGQKVSNDGVGIVEWHSIQKKRSFDL